MGFFKKDPKESAYVGGQKHWAESIENVGYGGDMITLHPDEDFNTNTVITVHPGEQAIFEKNGQVQQVFSEGRYVLKTENYPFISRIRNAFTGGVSTFNCRVYFVRTASSIEVTWGTKVQARDKKYHIKVDVFARGAYKVKVADAGRFLFKMLGNNLKSYEPTDIRKYFSNEFEETIVAELSSMLNNLDGEILGISSQTKVASDRIAPQIAERLDEYGMGLEKFSVAALEIKDSNTIRIIEEAEARASQERIAAQGTSDALKTISPEFDKYTAKRKLDIMEEAVKHPSTGAATAGVEMAMMGAAVGMMKDAMPQGGSAPVTAPPPPPPPPMYQYHAYINGQSIGPLTAPQLQQYVQQGYVTPSTLLWRQGMASWAAANSFPELASIFGAQMAPPPVPPMM